MQQQRLKIKKRGFTLVEIMVSVSIFSVVALIVTGAVITTSQTNRKAQAIKLAIDNLNFALDSIYFRVRHGDRLHCFNAADTPDPVIAIQSAAHGTLAGVDCNSGSTGLAFLEDNSASTTIYRYHAATQSIQYWHESFSSSNFLQITSTDNLAVTNLKFAVFNSEPTGGTGGTQPIERPYVRVNINARTKDVKNPTTFNLQTAISPR